MIAVLHPTATALLALLLATGAGFPDEGSYEASAAQSKVDDSISTTRIYTPLADVADRLTMIVQDDCEAWGECEWRDANGVRYTFWGDSPDDLHVVVKRTFANEFEGRPISALGVGMARDRAAVIANVRRFLPEVELDCDRTGPGEQFEDRCDAMLHPGWIRIWFDEFGRLNEVRLDGYHFT